MLRCLVLLSALLTSLTWFASSVQAEVKPLELKDGDRIVWVGGAFVERDQMYGYLETLLTAANPDKNLTFRNLGWSGDTVEGIARGVFGGANEGFQRLLKDLKVAQPTLVILCYGANEAHAGETGVAAFEANYKKLIDAVAQSGARIALVTPHRHEFVNRQLPDPSIYNNKLPAYIATIKKLANEKGCALIDLVDLVPATASTDTTTKLTDNGVHFTAYGYWRVAPQIATAMGVKFDPNKLALPEPKLESAEPSQEPLERLRRTINKKNEYWFHRHRPENETYLFLFRKHEQGNNAVEIPQFDPLIEAEEKQIAELKMLPAAK
ncbi:MAG TPA: SGNH/GDSL hydrolase family protein [Pirellulaceae bacterium]|nr:SGNH/GDSL hydrolase family protein [Pirellulaceae bacterium]